MQVELTRHQVSTIKTSLRFSLQRIEEYQHHPDYKTKKLMMKPVEEAMAALPDLRKAKEKK